MPATYFSGPLLQPPHSLRLLALSLFL